MIVVRVSDTPGSIPRGPLRITEFPRNQASRGDKLEEESGEGDVQVCVA